MNREDRERQRLLRHWARFMIMHLEGRETDPPQYDLGEALEHLRDLIDRELASLQEGHGPKAAHRSYRPSPS